MKPIQIRHHVIQSLRLLTKTYYSWWHYLTHPAYKDLLQYYIYRLKNPYHLCSETKTQMFQEQARIFYLATDIIYRSHSHKPWRIE